MKVLGENYYRDMAINIEKPLVFRNIAKDSIIKKLKKLCKLMAEQDQKNIDKIRNIYYDMCSELILKAEHHSFSGNILKKYIMYLLFYDENVYTLYCEKNNNQIDSSLYKVFLNDIKVIFKVMNFDMREVAELSQSNIDIQNYYCINKRSRKYEEDRKSVV